jgi:hypothetical protein
MNNCAQAAPPDGIIQVVTVPAFSMESKMNFDKALEELRTALEQEDYVLNEKAYEKATQLFLLRCQSLLRERSSEYSKMEQKKGSMEFFLNVDSAGLAHCPPRTLIEDFQKTAQQDSEFKLWFLQSKHPDKQEDVLLVARWLAHLAGLRHRCAHVFLDHPNYDDYTLIQIRSFSKSDSPGCFDIPVGEHAIGSESLSETCKRGLSEELGLCSEDIKEASLIDIGGYGYCEPSKRKDFYNIEHRTVFWGQVEESSMAKIRFVDKEVIGLCMFSISGLSDLLMKYPDRVASGLTGSLHIYMKHRKDKKCFQ